MQSDRRPPASRASGHVLTYRGPVDSSGWAKEHAAVLLKDLPTRWTHTEAVARQARLVAGALRLRHESDVLMAAAYLHDVGYAPGLRRSGFHPLDGAVHLRALGHERLARLVAYHSGARCEAEVRGLAQDLKAFTAEASVVADALTYCDMTTGPTGELVTLGQRLDDIERRHGGGSLVMEALRRAQPELERCVGVIEAVVRRDRSADRPGSGR
jgi:hypothetical protein